MNWKQKLTSRKFWVALAGLVVGVIALLGIQTDTAQITGVIMALGSVVAYIVGEGLVDAASAGAAVNITGNPTITGVGKTEKLPTEAQTATTGETTAFAASAPQTGTQGTSGAVQA